MDSCVALKGTWASTASSSSASIWQSRVLLLRLCRLPVEVEVTPSPFSHPKRTSSFVRVVQVIMGCVFSPQRSSFEEELEPTFAALLRGIESGKTKGPAWMDAACAHLFLVEDEDDNKGTDEKEERITGDEKITGYPMSPFFVQVLFAARVLGGRCYR